MTEPTDGELDAVLCNQWPAFSMQATLVRVWVRAAMRDALEKWGTPPAVAGEQFKVVSKLGDACLFHSNTVRKGDMVYTTPQPTQAQPVPLTDEQIEAAASEYLVDDFLDFNAGVRFAEKHHGIKGGQHG